MFERFTDRARRSVILAQDAAQALGHDHVGTGHLLFGLLAEGEGVAAQALGALGITKDGAGDALARLKPPTGEPAKAHLPFDARLKKACELGFREALRLGHNYVGTEYLLLGIAREGEGTAAKMLAALGTDTDAVHDQVLKLLRGYGEIREPRPIATVTYASEPTIRDVLAAVAGLSNRLGGIECHLGVPGIPAEPDDGDVHIDWHCTPDEFRQLAEALSQNLSPYVMRLRAEGKLELPAVTP